jgi:hypothetical protein
MLSCVTFCLYSMQISPSVLCFAPLICLTPFTNPPPPPSMDDVLNFEPHLTFIRYRPSAAKRGCPPCDRRPRMDPVVLASMSHVGTLKVWHILSYLPLHTVNAVNNKKSGEKALCLAFGDGIINRRERLRREATLLQYLLM